MRRVKRLQHQRSDNTGIALLNTSVPANFTLVSRLDAAGSTAESNTVYNEGTRYPALTPLSIEYPFVRDECGKRLDSNFGDC
jgi:hypothetical protein